MSRPSASSCYHPAPHHAAHETLRRVRLQLLEAGCEFDFHLDAWRCPSCRRWAALRLQALPDGSVHLRCEPTASGTSGCSMWSILESMGLTFLDVGPAAFRLRATP